MAKILSEEETSTITTDDMKKLLKNTYATSVSLLSVLPLHDHSIQGNKEQTVCNSRHFNTQCIGL